LNFNHPCKELIWVVQPDANVDYCSSLLNGTTLFRTLGAQSFNYTDAIDALPNAIHAFGGPMETDGANSFINTSGLFQMPGAADSATVSSFSVTGTAGSNQLTVTANASSVTVNVGQTILTPVGTFSVVSVVASSSVSTAVTAALNAGNVITISGTLPAALATATVFVSGGIPAGQTYGNGAYNPFDPSTINSTGTTIGAQGQFANSGSLVSDAGTFVLSETALDMHCWGQNPVVTAKLQLNGQDRFSEREGSYFDVVQPFQHHTRAPDTGINVYSFALRPEEHQPSGSCNFSRIDNATLQLVLSAPTVSGTSTAKVRVYAVNYNVLRVMSGMAGQAYSN
jgi:hypothetical protein